jgi:hypothetical protein
MLLCSGIFSLALKVLSDADVVEQVSICSNSLHFCSAFDFVLHLRCLTAARQNLPPVAMLIFSPMHADLP